MRVLAIDPGTTQSAWVLLDPHEDPPRILLKGITENNTFLGMLRLGSLNAMEAVIEQVEGMGMAVGKETFETVFWTGRFFEALETQPETFRVHRLTRRAVKLHLCGSSRAKDPNVRRALIDRYGSDEKEAKGTKKEPGPLYGVAKDEWAALAVGVTFLEERHGRS
jgi:hypothetical protein